MDQRIMPEPNSGCWLWMGSLDPNGYGRRVNGYKDHRPAHVVFWERRNGPMPEGMCGLHRCDVRCCVNPDHIFVGTKTDNSKDKVAKGRQGKGERYRNSKLRDADIPVILADTRPQTVIAAEYGVSRQLIGLVKRGRNWKHVRPVP